MDAVDPRLLAVGGLAHPPVVGGLRRRRAGVDRRDRRKHLDPPGVDLVTQGPVLEGVPLGPDHRTCVAGQLTGELGTGAGQELRRLDLLRHDGRLGLGTRARLVIGRERQEDDEAEQHGEARGQDPEDTRRPVTVGEVAALRRTPSDRSIAATVSAVTTRIPTRPRRMFIQPCHLAPGVVTHLGPLPTETRQAVPPVASPAADDSAAGAGRPTRVRPGRASHAGANNLRPTRRVSVTDRPAPLEARVALTPTAPRDLMAAALESV